MSILYFLHALRSDAESLGFRMNDVELVSVTTKCLNGIIIHVVLLRTPDGIERFFEYPEI